MTTSLKLYLKGLLTYVPGLYSLALSRRRSGSAVEPAYCYSVWMRHLISCRRHGMTEVPRRLGELGPGHSLGTGLAAVLCGTEEYLALDVVAFARDRTNRRLLQELVAFLQSARPVPHEGEWETIKPPLSDYGFPAWLKQHLAERKLLEAPRLRAIRAALDGEPSPVRIGYAVPWDSRSLDREHGVDMVFSQAVLEHVTDPAGTYGSLYRWLRPGGFLSLQIDFRCHDIHPRWNAHWTYSPRQWRLITGRRPFFINRRHLTQHTDLLRSAGFVVRHLERFERRDGLPQASFHPDFRLMPATDAVTAGAHIIATRPAAENRPAP